MWCSLLLRIKRCPLCAGRKLTRAGSNVFYYHLYCASCDLLFVGNLPSESEINAKYQDNYLPVRYNEHLQFSPGKEENWAEWLRVRNEFLEKLGIEQIEAAVSGSRKVLEIGCAEGKQMEIFIRRGWEAVGVEVGRSMAFMGRQRGLNIICDAFHEGIFAAGNFDLIIMSHVIEHFSDPLRTLEICRSILKNRGWLFLETPATPIFSDTDHLFFFSEKSIDLMCGKAGFVRIAHFFNRRSYDLTSDSCRFAYLDHYFRDGAKDYLAAYRKGDS